MICKQGTKINDQQESIILKNPNGEHFQVSYTTHMVWQMLDGETELETIATKMSTIADVKQDQMQELVEEIVVGLKNVDLIKGT